MKEYIDKIVNNGKPEDMDKLSNILIDLLKDMKNYNYDEYRKYKNEIKGMAYDHKIDEELAHEIVEDMKPLGEFWDINTVKNVIRTDNHRLEDMYVVMNSLANDYSEIISTDEVEKYIKLAHAWIDDVDGKENKIWWYFCK